MSTSYQAATLGAEEPAEIPPDATERSMPQPGPQPGFKPDERPGPTYYGRSQLKPAPFDEWVVGGYIFLAGISGTATMLSTLVDILRPVAGRSTVRNGRYLSLLAPVVGSPLLIWDLHTPQRFYNMMRIAKRTSPMSIGTWILTGFTGFACASVLGEAASALLPNRLLRAHRLARLAPRLAQIPAAISGAGLGTYTATLLSATSTPFWAASPRTLATRFAASSTASGASALALLEPDRGLRRRLEAIAALALAVEFGAGPVADRIYERTGVADARRSPHGRLETIGVTGLGIALPLGLQLAGLFTDRRTTRQLGAVASVGALIGSCLLRVATIGIGDTSARRPDISFRFSQPENLPDKAEGARIAAKLGKLHAARNKR